MDLRTIRQRLTALAARVPSTVRVPHLAVILDGDPDAEEKRCAAEAAGDPILRVELFDGETQP